MRILDAAVPVASMALSLVTVMKIIAVAIVAVGTTVYLEDDGAQRDKEAGTHTAEKHQGCSLRLVWNTWKLCTN